MNSLVLKLLQSLKLTEIVGIIHSFKSKKLTRLWWNNRKIMEACSSLISHPLSYICHPSLYTRTFHDCLKISIVKPLYKKEDRTSVTNYRTISLLTVSCKIFEKVMYSKLSHNMHTNKILVPEKIDLRQGKSPVPYLFIFVQKFQRWISRLMGRHSQHTHSFY